MSKLSTRDFIKEILKEDYKSEDLKNVLLNLLDPHRLKDCSVIERKTKNSCLFSGNIELSFDDNKEALLFLKIVKYLNKSGKDKLSILNANIMDVNYSLKDDGKTIVMKTIESQYVNSIEQGLKETKNMYSDIVAITVSRLLNLNLITNKQETSETFRNLFLNSGVSIDEQSSDKLSKIFAINSDNFLNELKRTVERSENGHYINGQQAAEIEKWLNRAGLEEVVEKEKRRDDLLSLMNNKSISPEATKENGFISKIEKSLRNIFGVEKPQRKQSKETIESIRVNRTRYA